MGEKIQHEKEMEESKDKFKNAVAGILIQRELFFYNWNYLHYHHEYFLSFTT